MLVDNPWYWPMAKTADGQTLFTYDSVSTIQEVVNCLETWSESYVIVEAWADIRTNGESGGKLVFQRKWCLSYSPYEGKTIRSIVKEINPSQVSDAFGAGVRGCPRDYREPVDLSGYDRCTAPGLSDTEKACQECWNQIYSTKEGV
jgi:hypothetical protein